MKTSSLKFSALTAAIGVAAIGGLLLTKRSPHSPVTGGGIPLDTHRSLGAPIVYKNLTVFPVVDASATETNVYTTLDEGLARIIHESTEWVANSHLRRIFWAYWQAAVLVRR